MSSEQRASRPNIIFIVADDLGFADLGCYGGRAPVSPTLDSLAAGGIKFSQGYSNSPVCSPTRFALMTARYQYRLRGAAEEPINSKARTSTVLGLPPDHPTLPSLLQSAGYRTALMGKWHLGYPPAFGPLRSGYNEFFGPMAGGVDYFTHCNSTGVHDLSFGEEEEKEDGYLTDLISHHAVDYVNRMAQQDVPFFLSLHYTAPHWPWETRDDKAVADNISHLQCGNIHTYQRMIHHMDEGIGWVMQTLEKHGLRDNTLVVFTSDNGGERFSDNWPFIGQKMDLLEGGIRVPLLARWPAQIQAGSRSATPAITMDWVATMLEAAGVAPQADHPLDGVSLMPLFKDAAWRPARNLYWRMAYRGQRALLSGSGQWKYLRIEDNDYLFDLSRDERERANQAAREPDRLAAMRAEWEQWAATMPGIPADAKVSLVFGEAQMPRPGH